MVKKETGKVVQINGGEDVGISKPLTPEEIEFIMKQDEDEMNSILEKHKGLLPKGPLSVEEEDDEDEEIFSLVDTEDGIQIVGVNDSQKKEVVFVEKTEEEKERDEFMSLFSKALVTKGAAKLLEELKEAEDTIYDLKELEYGKLGEVGLLIQEEASNTVEKKRRELRQAFGLYGQVDPSKLPSWAKTYVKDYVNKVVSGLAELID